MKVYEGKLIARGYHFGVIVSRFNELLSTRLLEGALDALKRHDASMDSIDVVWTPGAFEIPGVAKKMALTKKYDAIICLAVIIRGGTPHFEYIAAEVSKGIAQINLETGVPATYGVITADSIEQAIERAGTKSGNKGWQAAVSAIEMANLNKALG